VKRVLILTSVASMIDQFNMPHIRLLQKMGYVVDVACNFSEGSTCSDYVIARLKVKLEEENVRYYHIDFDRKITNIFGNIKAYNQVKKLARENNYSFIHCHSPIGGVVGRICGKATKTKVIYTAHGFHFHKKTSKKSWMIFYPVELLCSMATDVLITINKEDYALARKKMKAREICYVPGVGVNLENNLAADDSGLNVRRSLGIPEDSLMLVSVGEVNKNKNHAAIIKAIAKTGRSDIHYLICGKGALENELKILSKELGIEKQIHIPGFCENISEINKTADVFCFPSFREGLGLAALEAMAAGLPIITSDIHGINDYSENGKTGYKCSPSDTDGFARAILKLADDEKLRKQMGEHNKEIVKDFSLSVVLEKLEEIYEKM